MKNNVQFKKNSIKTIMKYLLRFFIKIINFMLQPFVIRIFSTAITYTTTEYIVKQLKKSGTDPLILFPIRAYGLHNIEIGNNFFASAGLILEAYESHLTHTYTPKIIILDNVRIGYDCHIGCVNKIVIGNNVLIASKVFITDHFHGNTTSKYKRIPPNLREVMSKGPVIIEDNVWIGEGVAIMPNVKIGKNSIVGANSVVTKDIPENCVVAGSPAKLIKKL